MTISVKTVPIGARKPNQWDGMLTGVYTLWLKHMLKFRYSGMEVLGTLATPMLWMLLFGVCMNGVVQEFQQKALGTAYTVYIMPGVMLLTSLSAAVLGGATLLLERINGVTKEYMVAPIPRLAVLLGTIASGLTKALIQSVVVLAVGAVLDATLHLSILSFVAAMLVVAVYSLGFVGIAAAFAGKARSTESYHILIMLVNLPVLFLSNALYPLAQMPPVIQTISYLNPTTYGIDAMRILLYGAKPEIGLGLDAAVLLGFMVLGLYYGFSAFQKWAMNAGN